MLRSFDVKMSDFKVEKIEESNLIRFRALHPRTEELMGYIHFAHRDGVSREGLEIVNFKASLEYFNLMRGGGTKANDHNQFGQFGEGLKLAALVFRRAGYTCGIESSQFQWDFRYHDGELAVWIERIMDLEVAKRAPEAARLSQPETPHPCEDVRVTIGKMKGDKLSIYGLPVELKPVSLNDFRKWIEVSLDLAPPDRFLARNRHGDIMERERMWPRPHQSRYVMYLEGLSLRNIITAVNEGGHMYAYNLRRTRDIGNNVKVDQGMRIHESCLSITIPYIWAAGIVEDIPSYEIGDDGARRYHLSLADHFVRIFATPVIPSLWNQQPAESRYRYLVAGHSTYKGEELAAKILSATKKRFPTAGGLNDDILFYPITEAIVSFHRENFKIELTLQQHKHCPYEAQFQKRAIGVPLNLWISMAGFQLCEDPQEWVDDIGYEGTMKPLSDPPLAPEYFRRYVEWAVEKTMTRFLTGWLVQYFDLPNRSAHTLLPVCHPVPWRKKFYVHRNWLHENTIDADWEDDDWYTVPYSLIQGTILPGIRPYERPEFKNHAVFRFLQRMPRPVACTEGPYPYSVLVRWKFGSDYQLRAPSNPYSHKILVILGHCQASCERK